MATRCAVEAADAFRVVAGANCSPRQVYWSNAVQIIPPHDGGIALRIDESLEVGSEAWDLSSPSAEPWSGTEEMKLEYIKMAGSLSAHRADNVSSDLTFTYTAMHGVGLPFAQAAFESFGFASKQLSIVEEQAQPDPKFPTVKFPNPEEKGAFR